MEFRFNQNLLALSTRASRPSTTRITPRTTALLLFAALAAPTVLPPQSALAAAPAKGTPLAAAAAFVRAETEADKALRDAITSGSAEKVAAALGAGADVNAASDDDGKTALMRAAALGRTDLVQLLVDKGADVNARDKSNKTALHYVLGGAAAAAAADAPAKKKRGFGGLVNQAKGLGGKALTLVAKAGPLAAFLPGGALLQSVAQGLALKDTWSGTLGNALLARSANPSALFGALDGLHGGTTTPAAMTTLLSAAKENNANALASLTNLGKEVTPQGQGLWGAYLAAVQDGDEAEIARITANPAFAPVLQKAAAKMEAAAMQLPGRDGGAAIVQLLLARGADTTVSDKDGNTALARAKTAKLDAVARLLEQPVPVQGK